MEGNARTRNGGNHIEHWLNGAKSPCPKRWAQVEQVREANRLVREWIAAQAGLVFAGIYGTALDEKGEPRRELFVQDGIHLTQEGYRLRAAALRPVLEKTLLSAP